MSALTGFTKYAFIVFFLTHIPITVFLNGPLLFPFLYPKFIKQLKDFYTNTFKDPVLIDPQPWILSITVIEIFLQLPFFVTALYVLFNPSKVDGTGWFRFASIVYGAVVTTTIIPCLGTIVADPNTNLREKVILVGLYLPYIAFPFWLLILGLVSEDILGNDDTRRLYAAL